MNRSDERAPADRGFVAIVGPPAAGKSTVTGALADRFGAPVFRVREFAYEFRSRPDIDTHLFDTCDPLGWFSDETVAVLLRAAFPYGRFAAQGLVLLENFPGNPHQIRLVAAIARELDVPLAVLELTAPDSLLTARARTRRVCPVCEPDPRGDPHRPARPRPGDLDRCADCGGRLAIRQSDTPMLFAVRLRRFRRRVPAIRREAAALRLPYQAVDATGDRHTCLQRATAALAAVETLAHLLAPCREPV